MSNFQLSNDPIDYVLSVHIQNLFETYGEDIVRGYIDQTATEIPYCHNELHRHVQNWIETYGAADVMHCWRTLFLQKKEAV